METNDILLALLREQRYKKQWLGAILTISLGAIGVFYADIFWGLAALMLYVVAMIVTLSVGDPLMLFIVGLSLHLVFMLVSGVLVRVHNGQVDKEIKRMARRSEEVQRKAPAAFINAN